MTINYILSRKFILRRAVFRLIAFLTFTIGIFVAWNWQPQNKPVSTHFLVHLPPEPIPLTPEQIAHLPNVCGHLVVSLKPDNSLRLNSDRIGSLDNLNQLSARLREIFEQRKQLKVFDEQLSYRNDLPDEERIVQQVIISAPKTAKYSDVVRIIDAVKGSGTNDIWLQLDGNNDWIFNKYANSL